MALLILSSEFLFFLSATQSAFCLTCLFNFFSNSISEALAQQMQAEEDHLTRRAQEAYVREQQERREREEGNVRPQERPLKEQKKKSECIIM